LSDLIEIGSRKMPDHLTISKAEKLLPCAYQSSLFSHSTVTFDERLALTKAILEESAGRIPVAMGVQTTNIRELIEFVKDISPSPWISEHCLFC
jgi:hypothetical protein